MKIIIITLTMLLSSLVLSQTSYENAMLDALNHWEEAQTLEAQTAAADRFDLIATENSTAWEPRYYAILIRSIQGFQLPKEIAIKAMDGVEEDYNQLILLEDNSEIKVLKGLFETVKISKDPMVYGRTLSVSINQTYLDAIKQNPENPRALFSLAQYEMNAAPYLGKNPKDSCPKVKKALALFEAEKESERKGFEPRWGLDQAQSVWESYCK